MKKITHSHVQLYAAIVLIMVGCGLLIAGFIVPPPGQIHNSVLIAFGEILTWSGSMLGIRYYYAGREGATGDTEAPEVPGR